MKKWFNIAGISLLFIAASCGNNEQWKVKGIVEGGAGKTVYLQSSQNGVWTSLDSVLVNDNGKFILRSDAPSVPAIYRIEMDGKIAYLPIDSVETLVFTSNADNFGTSYRLEGSLDAEILTRGNELISGLNDKNANQDSLKRLLGEQILLKPSGVSAYYLLNSTKADGTPIFNPSSRLDVKIMGAVANAFLNDRPSDPRTKILERMFLLSKASNLPEEVLQAKADSINAKINVENEVGYLDIELNDVNGNTRKLSEVVGNGPVVLNFTVYTEDYAPALNLILGELYNQYKGKGLEIFQVGFDSDAYEWRNVARNLPWIAVHNPMSKGTKYLIKYNTRVPMTFIINSNGDVVERVADPATLKDAVGRHL